MTQTSAIMDCPRQNCESLASELGGRVSSETLIRCHEPLARRTTLRVGGPADIYVEPSSEADLGAVLKFCDERAMKFFVLGRGSNLLVRDGGFRGLVICLAHSSFSQIKIADERLHCGAGAKLKQVAVEARRHGLSGVEFLEGIPGSVGGALRMNAGAMSGATFNAVETIRVMAFNGRVKELAANELEVEYRCCPFLKTHIALAAVFKCTTAPGEEIAGRMNAFSRKRWESQPAAPSAGCIFKNPATIPAGRLIDELGLKGLRVGGATVSLEHGNFIVNDGTATARDVLELIEVIKQRAKADRGIELQTEVEIIGEDQNGDAKDNCGPPDWQFADPKNLAVISLRSIVFGGRPNLHVTHDEDDGSWQFLGDGDAQAEDAAVVGLGEMVELDASVVQLRDLPLGWHAWRKQRGDPWHRERNQHEEA